MVNSPTRLARRLRMPHFLVEGQHPIRGQIRLSGAKNAASKIILATLLSSETSVIENVPLIGELDVAEEILQHAGATVQREGHRWEVNPSHLASNGVPELSRQNRLSVLALAPLLARTGQAEMPMVGGDLIGPRPINFHLAALRAMGAEITTTPTVVRAQAHRLQGSKIELPYPSVGATETIILAAVLANGRTIIRNAAIEPEVMDLLQMLQTMGAIVELGTDRVVIIDGVPKLHGTTYTVIPDRIEAASLACLALASRGEIFVEQARQADLLTFLTTIRRMGAAFSVQADGIVFRTPGRLQAVKVETDTHPGFMTDWQQPLVAVMTQADGVSIMHETVYEDRFGYTATLRDMGADIQTSTDCWGELPCRWHGRQLVHSCRVTGPSDLHGATITVPDIRAGMAHLIAAMVARGTSTLHGIEHLDRGYERLDERLRGLGAHIVRRQDE